MSAAAPETTGGPERRPTAAEVGPVLRLLPAPRFRPPRAPFVAVIVALLAVGLLGLLYLNTVIARNAFTLRDLNQTNGQLTLNQQALEQRIVTSQAPQNLAAQAKKLGMVPAGAPGFVKLPSGTVVGSPSPAVKPQPIRIKGVGPGSNAGRGGQ